MILWTIVIALSVILDQVSKAIVIATVPIGHRITAIPGILNITHIKNLGAAWGMLSGARWIFIIISIAAIIILPIILYKYRKLHFLFGFSMSLIIGGAIGNIIDRLFSGNGVTDFIEFAFVDFPIFNVADICVTVGAVMMFIYLVFIDKTFFMTKDSKKEKKDKSKEAENCIYSGWTPAERNLFYRKISARFFQKKSKTDIWYCWCTYAYPRI